MQFSSTRTLGCTPETFRELYLNNNEFTRAHYAAARTRKDVVVGGWQVDPAPDQQERRLLEGLRSARTVEYRQLVPSIHSDGKDLNRPRADVQWAFVRERQIRRLTPEGTLHLVCVATIEVTAQEGRKDDDDDDDDDDDEEVADDAARALLPFGKVRVAWMVIPKLDERRAACQIQVSVTASYTGKIGFLREPVERSLFDEVLSSIESFWLRADAALNPSSSSSSSSSSSVATSRSLEAIGSDSDSSSLSSDEHFFEPDTDESDDWSPKMLRADVQGLTALANNSRALLRSLENRVAALEQARPSKSLAVVPPPQHQSASSSSVDAVYDQRLAQLADEINKLHAQEDRYVHQNQLLQKEILERTAALESFQQFSYVVFGAAAIATLFWASPKLRQFAVRPFNWFRKQEQN